MAGELSMSGVGTGKTIVATIAGLDRTTISNGVDAFVPKSSLTDAQRAAAAVSCPEMVSGDATPLADYVGDLPAHITTPGVYFVTFWDTTPDPENYVGIQFHEVKESKTGYSLASDGLDQISAAEPTGKPTTFPGWLRWLVQRHRRADKSTSEITVLTEAGATVTTQAISDDSAGNETLGAPS